MSEHDKSSPAAGVALTFLSALLVGGIQTFAAPCGTHGDGSVGSCLWAARAVLGAGVVLLVISVVRIFERDEGERRGLSFAAACLGVLVAMLPSTLIELCPVATMRCHTLMRPFTLCVGAAVAVVGGTDLMLRLLRLRKPRTTRRAV